MGCARLNASPSTVYRANIWSVVRTKISSLGWLAHRKNWLVDRQAGQLVGGTAWRSPVESARQDRTYVFSISSLATAWLGIVQICVRNYGGGGDHPLQEQAGAGDRVRNNERNPPGQLQRVMPWYLWNLEL
jgi:hypothetical protein